MGIITDFPPKGKQALPRGRAHLHHSATAIASISTRAPRGSRAT